MEHNYKTTNIRITQVGQQDCNDMHSWGPGMRLCFIIHYVVRGAGYLKTEQGTFRIEEGQSFLIWPYTVIHYYPDKDNPWKYVWVNFEGDVLEAWQQNSIFTKEHPICDKLPENKLYPLFMRLMDLDITRQNRQEANGILMTLLGIYEDLNNNRTDNNRKQLTDSRLEEALLLIRVNYHHADFGIPKLCASLNISRITLYRMFQNNFNLSPNQYLIQYRMLQAQTMLSKGASVKTASLSCGFDDPLYFSRAFKQFCGVSPSIYKTWDL